MKLVALKIKRLKTQNLKTTDEIKSKIFYIQNVGLQLNWKIEAYYYKSNRLLLQKEGVKMDVNLVSNNVITTLKHPNYKKLTNLQRDGLEMHEIAALLFNPREHVGGGRILQHKKKKYGTTKR